MHLEAIPFAPIGTVIGSGVGMVIAETVTASADPTTNLLLIAVVAGGFTFGGTVISTLINAHFTSQNAVKIAEVTAHAQEAARAAQASTDATKELSDKTDVMSGRLDGKLEELIRLSRAEAEAQGVQKERARGEAKADEVLAQTKIDAATVRKEEKEDRQEIRDAAVVPIPLEAPAGPTAGITGTPTDPVHIIIANPSPVPVVEMPRTADEAAK